MASGPKCYSEKPQETQGKWKSKESAEEVDGHRHQTPRKVGRQWREGHGHASILEKIKVMCKVEGSEVRRLQLKVSRGSSVGTVWSCQREQHTLKTKGKTAWS